MTDLLAEFLQNPQEPLTPKTICYLIQEPSFLEPVFRKALKKLGEGYMLVELEKTLELYEANTEKRLDTGGIRSLGGILLKRLKNTPYKRYIF